MLFTSDYVILSTNGKEREMYINHAFIFLTPLLQRFYGDNFLSRYVSISKLFLGTKDECFVDCDGKPYICLLFYTDRKVNEMIGFLDWLRDQDYYISDYFYGHAATTNKHVVLLEIPTEYQINYQRFIQGIYSSMYPEKVLDNLNIQAKDPKNFWVGMAVNVVNKTEKAKETLIKVVNKEFNTNITDFEGDFECDFPPLKYHQHLNYTENDSTYCRTKG